MLDLSQAAVVDFPLRGEWVALNTPAERIPSHGTDYFGQRYAFDFVQTDSVHRFYPHSPVRHLVAGLPATSFYCWDRPVYSAFAGTVVAIGDGWPDRRYVHALWELFRTTVLTPVISRPRNSDYRPLTGNFVLIEGTVGVALYAHLHAASLRVRPGEQVTTNTLLGRVGNSGNATMPHLHFHLMDGRDPFKAAGRACAFRAYDRFVDGCWLRVDLGVPGRMERIRAA